MHKGNNLTRTEIKINNKTRTRARINNRNTPQCTMKACKKTAKKLEKEAQSAKED